MTKLNILIRRFIFISIACILLCSSSHAMEKNVNTCIQNNSLCYNNSIWTPITEKEFKIQKARKGINQDKVFYIDGHECIIVYGRIIYSEKSEQDILDLNKCKYALFEIKTMNDRIEYYYCSDIESIEYLYGDKRYTQGLFQNIKDIKCIKILASDTSEVTNMSCMFSGCLRLTVLNLSNFNTSKVTNMSKMFEWCSSLQVLNLFNFNTSNVEDMSYMFYNCTSLKSVFCFTNCTGIDTSKVKNMSFMFSGCSSLQKLDLKNFDTSNVTNMNSMFFVCTGMKYIIKLFKKNTFKKVLDTSYMFAGCLQLESLDLSNFNTIKVTNMSYMFTNCCSLQELDLSKFKTYTVIDMAGMFAGCNSLSIIKLNKTHFVTGLVKNMSNMFAKCTHLQELNLSHFNTKNVENMRCMFAECSNLKNLDLSNFNTSNVTDMSEMFSDCINLINLDLRNFTFDFNNKEWLPNMFNMFKGCRFINIVCSLEMMLIFNNCNIIKPMYSPDIFNNNIYSYNKKIYKFKCFNLYGDCLYYI